MHATVSNFRGLIDLRASIAPMLLLAGFNGAGKSSACSAIAAAASGSMLPFDGLTKKAAGLLVRDGADLATVHLEDSGETSTASWPAAERMVVGGWRDISPAAAGLEDITKLKPADRAALLIELIGALPSVEDLKAALTEAKIPSLITADVIKQVGGGWDGAHLYFQKAGAILKGRWEQVAGIRYGKTKAAGWRPADWLPTMEGRTAEEFAADIVRQEQELQDITAKAGASQAQIDAWQALADTIAQLQNELTARETEHTAEVTRATQMAEELAALGDQPEPGAEPLICPCCSKAVRFRDGALVVASSADFAELSEQRTQWDAAAEQSKRAADRRDMALRHFQSAERKLQEAQDAATKLEQAKAAETSTTQEDIDQAKAKLDTTRRTAEMAKRVADAKMLADKIQHVADVTDLLDKDGLRQKTLGEALGDFNGKIVDICDTAKWAPVHVDADMGITFGGRPISLCSTAEQYRARISLQLAVAITQGASLVVMDGADVLDRAGRNGLFATLRSLAKSDGIRAVIGMTLLKQEDMPDLTRAGLGESVWIEGGAATRAPVREAA